MWNTNNKFRNISQPNLDVIGDFFSGPSLTVPDMVPPLSVLIERYTLGNSLPVKQGVFTDDPEFASISRMTPLDRAVKAAELRKAVEQQREELFRANEERKRVAAVAKAAEEKAAKAAAKSNDGESAKAD